MYNDVEILMVEDNPNDEMLALHAFKRSNLVNNLYVVRDGAEALEFIFCTGAYAEPKDRKPKINPARSEVAPRRRHRSAAANSERPAHENDPCRDAHVVE